MGKEQTELDVPWTTVQSPRTLTEGPRGEGNGRTSEFGLGTHPTLGGRTGSPAPHGGHWGPETAGDTSQVTQVRQVGVVVGLGSGLTKGKKDLGSRDPPQLRRGRLLQHLPASQATHPADLSPGGTTVLFPEDSRDTRSVWLAEGNFFRGSDGNPHTHQLWISAALRSTQPERELDRSLPREAVTREERAGNLCTWNSFPRLCPDQVGGGSRSAVGGSTLPSSGQLANCTLSLQRSTEKENGIISVLLFNRFY